MFSEKDKELAAQILQQCQASGLTFATAESCTGGLISALITSVSGASSVFTHGFVTYANEAKTDMLGVSAALIAEFGAVSAPVACAMAEGACVKAQAQLAVSVTGIAGPTGGSAEKPVGLVHIACAGDMLETLHIQHIFTGNREQIRLQAVQAALQLVQKALG